MKKALIISILILIAAAIGINQIPSQVESESTNTKFSIVNTSQDSVLCYLTLSGYAKPLNRLYVQDVKGIFGIQQTGLVGSFYLHANDSVSYTSKKRFSANVCFGSQPLNCPDTAYPTGVNLFEFNLNVPQESIDISCMAGVNSIMNVKLIEGPKWVATQSYPDVRFMRNDSMYKNTNLVGVFPYGCTNCVNTQGKQSCQTPSETPDSTRICNPTRAKNEKGGEVKLIFNGYTN